MADYFVYILRCRDGSLYTGITNDLDKRLKAHSEGRGSRYVRRKMPFELVYVEKIGEKSNALKRELEIKPLAKAEKELLVFGALV